MIFHETINFREHSIRDRAGGMSDNLGGGANINLMGINMPPLVGIGLTDLPKSGGEGENDPHRFRRPCVTETQ